VRPRESHKCIKLLITLHEVVAGSAKAAAAAAAAAAGGGGGGAAKAQAQAAPAAAPPPGLAPPRAWRDGYAPLPADDAEAGAPGSPVRGVPVGALAVRVGAPADDPAAAAAAAGGALQALLEEQEERYERALADIYGSVFRLKDLIDLTANELYLFHGWGRVTPLPGEGLGRLRVTACVLCGGRRGLRCCEGRAPADGSARPRPTTHPPRPAPHKSQPRVLALSPNPGGATTSSSRSSAAPPSLRGSSARPGRARCPSPRYRT
jgi:hypothetical protein